MRRIDAHTARRIERMLHHDPELRRLWRRLEARVRWWAIRETVDDVRRSGVGDPISAACRRHGVSRRTVYRALRATMG